VSIEGGSQNRDSDFHTQYILDRPVEKNIMGWDCFWRKIVSIFRIIVVEEGECCKVVRK
jgi:hypothetical protein